MQRSRHVLVMWECVMFSGRVEAAKTQTPTPIIYCRKNMETLAKTIPVNFCNARRHERRVHRVEHFLHSPPPISYMQKFECNYTPWWWAACGCTPLASTHLSWMWVKHLVMLQEATENLGEGGGSGSLCTLLWLLVGLSVGLPSEVCSHSGPSLCCCWEYSRGSLPCIN